MKYGVKLTAIDVMDFDDLKIICEAIKKLGYKITVVDNGNFVCEKDSEIADKTGSKDKHPESCECDECELNYQREITALTGEHNEK